MGETFVRQRDTRSGTIKKRVDEVQRTVAMPLRKAGSVGPLLVGRYLGTDLRRDHGRCRKTMEDLDCFDSGGHVRRL